MINIISGQILPKHKTEISTEKTKLLTHSVNGMQRENKINRLKYRIVTSFKYLGAAASNDDFKPKDLMFSQGLNNPPQPQKVKANLAR